jgi:hypothetical protein
LQLLDRNAEKGDLALALEPVEHHELVDAADSPGKGNTNASRSAEL